MRGEGGMLQGEVEWAESGGVLRGEGMLLQGEVEWADAG